MTENPGDLPGGLQHLLSELRQLHVKSRELLSSLKLLNEQLVDLKNQTRGISASEDLDAIFTAADKEFLAKISQACG